MSLCSKSGIEEVGGERAGDTGLRRRWETPNLAYMYQVCFYQPIPAMWLLLPQVTYNLNQSTGSPGSRFSSRP
jgi:hypothetical protein